MAFTRFREYLDAKGKTVEKPVIDPEADTGPKGDKSPEPFATKGKGWEDKAAVKDKAPPYAAPWEDKGQQVVGDKKRLSTTYEKGFGDDGDKKLKAEYKPGDLDPTKDRKKPADSWPKVSGLKSEVVARTRELPMNEFSTWVRENKDGELVIPEVFADKKGLNRPDPVQAIRYVTFLAAYNDSILEHLVREINRSGYVARLVASAFRHPDAFDTVGMLYGSSPTFKRRLHNALEATDVPIDQEEDEEEDEEGQPDQGKKPTMPDQGMNVGDGPGGVQTTPQGGGPEVPGLPGAPGGSAGPKPGGPTGQTLQPSMMRR
jgi:hypothetical protein